MQRPLLSRFCVRYLAGGRFIPFQKALSGLVELLEHYGVITGFAGNDPVLFP